MGKKRKLVESCNHHHQSHQNHNHRLQSSASVSSLSSIGVGGDCHICGKELSSVSSSGGGVGNKYSKTNIFSRKKSKKQGKNDDDIILNFRIPNPVSLFSNRVRLAKSQKAKTPFFNNLKVKCRPVGTTSTAPMVPKRGKRAKNEFRGSTSKATTKLEEEEPVPIKQSVCDEGPLLDEDLYCIPNEVTPKISATAPSSQRQQHLPLRPLFFEVPLEESQVFVPRNWIFSQIEAVFSRNMHARGVVLYGAPGTGKTAVALELVEYSCFGRKRDFDPEIESGRISAMSLTMDEDEEDLDPEFDDHCYDVVGLGKRETASDNQTAFKTLVLNVVAYHFCQLDNRLTCLVPEFIHSLAAQLCQAPSLLVYRDYLLENPNLLDTLSIENCTVNPGKAFLDGIIQPLIHLRKTKRLTIGNYSNPTYFLIIIDSIGEAECHKIPTRGTISSFLTKQIMRVPHWLKFIVTIRTSQLDIMKLIPFSKISLDSMSEEIEEDLHSYISYRLSSNPTIKDNVTGSLMSLASTCTGSRSEANILKCLKNHLAHLSGGCFLYLKLTLDLIQHRHLVIKSLGFKVLPISLSQVFSLHCNLRFPTSRAFDMVHPILSTCLAALNPLTLLEIYHSINSLRANDNLDWTHFLRIFKNLKGLLIKRLDGTYMFFHSSFRDWLMMRRDTNNDSCCGNFRCDIKTGNSAIALRLTSIEAPLTPNKTIELAHHILKAGMFKNRDIDKRDPVPASTAKAKIKDLQAMWLLTATKDISSAISSFSNVYTPNPKVTRMLLESGASPNSKTEYVKNAPLMGAYAATGLETLVTLLIDFGGDVNATNDDGDTPLHLACEKGYLSIVNLLVDNGAVITQLNKLGESALVKAARNNQVEVLLQLTSLEENYFTPVEKIQVVKEVMITGCKWNHFDVVDLCADLITDFNFLDDRTGESPLSMASRRGNHHIVSALILEGASPDLPNAKGEPPLILAAREQHHRVIEALVDGGCNLNSVESKNKKTSVMFAAKQNDLISLEYLIGRGANLKLRDKDGICVLGWACLRNRRDVVELLLDSMEGSVSEVEVNGVDNFGRTPLDLAAFTGAEEIAIMLLERGAVIEHVDVQGVRPLDRAVRCGHTNLVQLFLRRGAKLGSNTWASANSKPQIIKCLLSKLLEDGVFLLHQGQFQEAAHRFQYSLKKLTHFHNQNQKNDFDFDDIWKSLALNFVRCKAEMNELEEAMTMIRVLSEKFPDCAEIFESMHDRDQDYRNQIQEFMEKLAD